MKRIVVDEDQRVGKWVCERAGGETHSGCKTIGLEQDGWLVAGVVISDYNRASVMMHVAAEGKNWLNREFLWFCFHYPFVQLGVKKIIGPVASTNAAALKFDKHLGFVEECVIKNAHPDGDLIILTMTRQQCRFLKDRHG